MLDFRAALTRQVVVFDGAMGTEIYRRGVFINQAFEALNLTSPELVRSIHEAYLRAGAQVLTTNTYGAGRKRMREFGLDDQFEAINAAGVRIAREVAGERAWIAASIGPLGRTIAPVGRLEPGQAFAAFKEQALALAGAKPDLFVLETFHDPRELWQAVRAVRSVSELPIAACIAFSADANGNPPPDAAHVLHQVSSWPVEVVGVNCGAGPRTLLEIVEAAAPLVKKPILVMPNAGHPQDVDGRQIYLASPEYMAEYARRFVQKGARAVGGCCGTTPEMIKEIRTFIRSVSPGIEVLQVHTPPSEERVVSLEPTPVAKRTTFAQRLMSGKFCISVELDPPRGLNPAKSVEGAAFLYEHGIDVINIADGPRAVARMGPTPLAYLAKQRCGIESVVHYCCRDRNLLAMQMDLIGANALGLRNILAVTGDPPKMGSYPNATAVFDVDSIGLIAFIQMLNRGLDFAGRPLGKGEKTELFVGAGCNPAHVDLDLEVERFGRKIEAGAEFFFSQPVYDEDILFRFLERTERFPKVPFLVGILPLASYKNAEFLHNEVPGMAVPAPVLDRLRKAESRDAQRQVGIEVARETLTAVRHHPRINGAYIYPPFGSYQRVLDVVEGIR
ncbi:MAG: bifunctional homocysteine S-methyltransferase/methylenetetrahydrofolate reductase [Deltaproteobacteria bacterium]|nr:bifunctional homocysteine S-methyltransferase/methylenetetrahydrofolate reductase [Deltaproteobacteria bacterium]